MTPETAGYYFCNCVWPTPGETIVFVRPDANTGQMMAVMFGDANTYPLNQFTN